MTKDNTDVNKVDNFFESFYEQILPKEFKGLPFKEAESKVKELTEKGRIVWKKFPDDDDSVNWIYVDKKLVGKFEMKVNPDNKNVKTTFDANAKKRIKEFDGDE